MNGAGARSLPGLVRLSPDADCAVPKWASGRFVKGPSQPIMWQLSKSDVVERARRGVPRSGGRWFRLVTWVVAREPEHRVRLHWIGFRDGEVDVDVNVMAAGTLERSDGKRGSATRHPCQAHMFAALGTVWLIQ